MDKQLADQLSKAEEQAEQLAKVRCSMCALFHLMYSYLHAEDALKCVRNAVAEIEIVKLMWQVFAFALK